LQKNKVDQLPVKSKKLKVRNRYFNYLVLEDETGNTIIQKRTDKGIWHNLYEFPLIETDATEDFDSVVAMVQKDFGNQYEIISMLEYNEKSIIHKLSHQHLHIKFWKVSVKGTIENGIDGETLRTFPFPIVIHNFIENNRF
jgi:A/G-specific adenine glycosylase